jgi:hypothetical protein
MSRNDVVGCDDCELMAQTEKAAKVKFADGSEHWIPWSIIDDGSDLEKNGDTGTLYLPRWKAEEIDVEINED